MEYFKGGNSTDKLIHKTKWKKEEKRNLTKKNSKKRTIDCIKFRMKEKIMRYMKKKIR